MHFLRSGRVRRAAAVALPVVAASVVLAACGGGGSTSGSTTANRATTPSTTGKSAAAPTAAPSSTLSMTWSLPGADLQNNRDAGGPINASNVSTLGVAWTDPIKGVGAFGSYSATPVVANGVMYTQDLSSDVEAINVSTGKVVWTKAYNSPNVGPDGVTVVNGVVYGATGTSAFALQARTGEQLWSKKITRNANEGVDMAPGYNDGTVYVSTVPGNGHGFYVGNGQAILWAMDAKTGATKWKWDEVPTNLWSDKHTNINSGGGQWDPPTFDSQGNLYVGVANPAPFTGTPKFPWGSSRPGPDLYTDSIVKLNAKTGKLMWYYQLTPHDINDWDMENSPILATVNGQQLAIDGGKAGIIVAVNAQTGKLVWKRPVGVHNGHTHDGLLAESDPAKLHLPETVEPGDLGGIESQLASNGTIVFAAVNNLPSKYVSQGLAGVHNNPAKGTGDLVAVNEATGKVQWDDKLPSSPYGAATLANNVVFTTTFDGVIYAMDASTGKELWHAQLPAGTNAPVAVVGDTVLTAGSFPETKNQRAEIVAYRLGATGAPSTSSSTSTTSSTTTTAAQAPTAGPHTLNIAAMPSGMLMFTNSKLTAKAGKLTVNFTNSSPEDHDVVLINSKNKILGKTPIFDHGTKSFSVTLTPGTYTYYCSVPGHRAAGMQGTLTVQ
jgi:outer membrane protein assembly factor BamB